MSAFAARSQHRWSQAIAVAAIFVYCAVFLVHAPDWLPDSLQHFTRSIQKWTHNCIHRSLASIASGKRAGELSRAVYFALIAGAIPMAAARVLRRRPNDAGWRKPNCLLWRYCIVAIALSLPFLLWMVQSPTMTNSYLKQLERLGFAAFAAFYLVNMFTEHLLLHGVVLGLTRSDGRWSSSIPISKSGYGIRAIMRWLGLGGAVPGHSSNRLSAWLGLAPGCIGPMLFSALLFGMVHLGKDSRELILSFPGGLAQSYMAYRSNSWFTPFLIHLGTASTALAMMVLL